MYGRLQVSMPHIVLFEMENSITFEKRWRMQLVFNIGSDHGRGVFRL